MKLTKVNEIRRRNAKLYPIYKMFSWDLLFFYSIEFLFCTITKGLSASEFLIISGLYMVFKVIGQIPAVAITDFIGKRNSLILGNIMVIVYCIVLIVLPGAVSILIANFIFAIASNIKDIAGPNLLYDSVATKGGDGLYSKLEARGGSFYYLLDGVASLLAGYLFLENQYLPMYICLGFSIISTLLSFEFHDVYPLKKVEKTKRSLRKEYYQDLKASFQFIARSKRMKAYILFGAVFYGMIETIEVYQGDLLVEVGISAQYFSMIFAILTFIRGISVVFQKQIERKFKNRTLTFLSLLHITSTLLIGVVATFFTGNLVIAIILLMCSLEQIISAIWYVLEAKYIKNFTTQDVRNRMNFTYEFIGGIGGSMIAILGGILLDYFCVANAYIIAGLVALGMMTLTLEYMKTRFGLKPEQYPKEDIEFEMIENKDLIEK